ncbi:hypothetical protein CS542_04510 [Pedobacter sp. IW39]|nr:hypothetical protein CS542_04510 [Pedobacter sp. IW39]
MQNWFFNRFLFINRFFCNFFNLSITGTGLLYRLCTGTPSSSMGSITGITSSSGSGIAAHFSLSQALILKRFWPYLIIFWQLYAQAIHFSELLFLCNNHFFFFAQRLSASIDFFEFELIGRWLLIKMNSKFEGSLSV